MGTYKKGGIITMEEIKLPEPLTTNSSSISVSISQPQIPLTPNAEIKANIPAPVASFRRKRNVGDLINFDGELYRIRKFTTKGDVVLRCLNDAEAHEIIKRRRQIEDDAIRRAKATLEEDKKKIIEVQKEYQENIGNRDNVIPIFKGSSPQTE